MFIFWLSMKCLSINAFLWNVFLWYVFFQKMSKHRLWGLKVVNNPILNNFKNFKKRRRYLKKFPFYNRNTACPIDVPIDDFWRSKLKSSYKECNDGLSTLHFMYGQGFQKKTGFQVLELSYEKVYGQKWKKKLFIIYISKNV